MKILKWVGIVILAIVLLLAILLFILSKKPFVPSNYTKTVETGGELEAKYLAMGEYEVKHTETDAPEDWGKFITYYPAAVETADKTYPVVVVVNGTGVYASKYPVLFKHLASWGFIVIGNEDPSTCSGDSADAALAYLSEQNDDPDSVFYRKVDTAHIGITGHSQGGVGVFNAVTQQPHGNLYTCAVSLSPTEMELADAIGLHYEPDKMTVPTLLLAADANDVISPEGTQKVYAGDSGSGLESCHPQPQHRRIDMVLRGRISFVIKRAANRSIQRGDLEAFQKMGRCADRCDAERQGSAVQPGNRKYSGKFRLHLYAQPSGGRPQNSCRTSEHLAGAAKVRHQLPTRRGTAVL